MEVKYSSANQRSGPCLICNHSSKKKQHFLRTTQDKSSSKCHGPRYPSWISHCFKKIQHFFMTTRGTFVVSLVTCYAVVLKKKLKSWKVYDIRTDDRQTDAGHISVKWPKNENLAIVQLSRLPTCGPYDTLFTVEYVPLLYKLTKRKLFTKNWIKKVWYFRNIYIHTIIKVFNEGYLRAYWKYPHTC